MELFIKEALEKAGDKSLIRDSRPVSGGSINQTYYVKTQDNEYFVKLNQNTKSDFFKREAEGLQYIRETQTVKVPRVYYYNEPGPRQVGVLVQEWMGGGKQPTTNARLGRDLADLHQNYGLAFGLKEDNYVGEIDQPNGWYDSWVQYYREQRLLNQIQYAEKIGRMPLERRNKAEKLLENIEQWIPDDIQPSLLHGDLWAGNFMGGPTGEPVLIDPAVLYGHNEFDIAFTEMFGGFMQDFYDEYRELIPLDSDYQDRKPIYQLFYLLVHLNIFGGHYAESVDRVLNKYV